MNRHDDALNEKKSKGFRLFVSQRCAPGLRGPTSRRSRGTDG